MKFALTLALLVSAAALVSGQSGSFYDLKTKTLLGKNGDLAQYKGKVSLVVNVASKCGFTPQYEGLETLQREMKGPRCPPAGPSPAAGASRAPRRMFSSASAGRSRALCTGPWS